MATYQISATIDYSGMTIAEVDAVTFLPFLGTGVRTATFHLSQLEHSGAAPPPITITGGLGSNELVLKLEPINGVTPDFDLLDDLVFVNWNDDDRLTLIGGDGGETINGTAVDDMIFGADGDDRLRGSAGNDTLYGGVGDDWLYIVAGDNDSVFGGTGKDRVYIEADASASAAIDFTSGTGSYGQNDFSGFEELDFTATGGSHSILGGAGFDHLRAFGGAVVNYRGAGGNDVFSVRDGSTGSVDGGSGIDTLNLEIPTSGSGSAVALSIDLSDGGGGRNIGTGMTVTGVEAIIVEAGGANDYLRGGTEFDIIDSGGGNDTVVGGAGADLMYGGSGIDTMSYQYSLGAVNVDLDPVTNASGGDAAGDIVQEFENLTGGLGNDTLTGSSAANVLVGSGGGDRLIGEGGADTLTGGSGADVFVFVSTADSSASASDRITDMVRGSDKIDLGGIDASTLALGNNAFAFIGTAAFSPGVAGQLRYSTSIGNTTILGDTNGDGTADLRIVLTGVYALSASDFVL